MTETTTDTTKSEIESPIARQILGEMFRNQTEQSTARGVAHRVQMLRHHHLNISMEVLTRSHENHIFLVVPDHGLVSGLVHAAIVGPLSTTEVATFADPMDSTDATMYLLPFERFRWSLHDALPHASDYLAGKRGWTRPVVCVDEVGITLAEAYELGVYPGDVVHLVDMGDVGDVTNWAKDPHANASALSIIESDLRQTSSGEISKLARKHLRKAMRLIEAAHKSASPSYSGEDE